ncbi:thiol:disulfide interchange protein DsbA/DsbL [Ferrimonas balearica]|uniref:thiol:disulfide interchange protein DsbA/DsbL n=1 Tax=Ferrimonas balearica TaxID=44012 RepID=UPI001C99C7EF|nr:thiol:disulfide interchange protein DsbA/DsbL [Ferrimonas balearica]MBY5993315.1 thiol:disulfide interchange protein DsbA/DsbL [Ferrimonas balearica]
MKKMLAIAFALVLAPLSAFAAATDGASNFKEGTHYTTFNQSPVNGQPTVTEFFSFYCPHCYTFEKNYVGAIKAGLADGVEFEQYHVDFIGREMGPEMSRALAVAQLLKVQDTIKPAMFSAIHDARRTFTGRNDVRQLFVDNGVSATDFDKAAESFMVNSTMKKWKKAQQDSGIRGVPSLMVNNKYIVDVGSVQSLEELTDLLNYLAKKG